jgi:hypothetical protein
MPPLAKAARDTTGFSTKQQQVTTGVATLCGDGAGAAVPTKRCGTQSWPARGISSCQSGRPNVKATPPLGSGNSWNRVKKSAELSTVFQFTTERSLLGD